MVRRTNDTQDYGPYDCRHEAVDHRTTATPVGLTIASDMLPAMVPVTVNYKRNADLQKELREKAGGGGQISAKLADKTLSLIPLTYAALDRKVTEPRGGGVGGGGRRGIGADLAYQSSTTDRTNSLETGSAITNCRDLAYRVVILFSFIHAFPSPPTTLSLLPPTNL